MNIVETYKTPDGIRYFQTDKIPIEDDNGSVTGFVGVGVDITERVLAEEKIEHLNLVLRAVRNVNQLTVKENRIDRLIKGICENLIENRGYYNAWIVLIDASGKAVDYAEAGLGEKFSHMAEMFEAGELTECARKTLSRDENVSIEDPLSTCKDCPLSGNYGGRGAMTVKLEYGERIFGILCVSIPKEFVRDREEIELLREVAGDVAYALHDIELGKQRKWWKIDGTRNRHRRKGMLRAEIRVKGQIDKHWADWFEGLTVMHTDQDETVLAGFVIDQSALYGLLAKLRDLGLSLLSVSTLEMDDESEEEGDVTQ